MLDFCLENQFDWKHVIVQEGSQLLQYWEQIEAERSKTPFIDQIETTNACPFSCVMCPRGRGLMTRPVEHMEMELFKDLLLQIETHYMARRGTKYDDKEFKAKYWRDSIETTGLRLHHFGSPLSDPMFEERVSWIKKHCSFPVHVSISADQLSGKRAYDLVASGIDRIIVALDGHDEETYKSIRGKNASYAKACKGIDLLLESRDKLRLNTLIDIQLIEINDTPEKCHDYKRKWSEAGAEALIKPLFHYPDVKIEGEKSALWSGPCSWPFISMTITVNGKIVPCCADYNAENVIGDASVESLQEIWDGEKYRDFRKEFFLNQMDKNSLCCRCGFYR